MAPTDTSLEERIVRLLNSAGTALSMHDLEDKLSSELGRRVDTFAVRDAVWRLIGKRKADLTPLWDLRATAS